MSGLFIFLSLPLGVWLFHVWQFHIRPRLIPEREINAMAEELIARHGPRAGEIALIEEGRAWRCSDTFTQGKWRRVRREIGRRCEAGEWYGPESRDRQADNSPIGADDFCRNRSTPLPSARRNR